MQQKFRLPKITKICEKGLTKDIINCVLRFANPKLATAILIACSNGMRIAEIIQLKLSDIDLTTNPTIILIRADTTKTRETRITHISSEATMAFKDYLARENKSHTRQENQEKRSTNKVLCNSILMEIEELMR